MMAIYSTSIHHGAGILADLVHFEINKKSYASPTYSGIRRSPLRFRQKRVMTDDTRRLQLLAVIVVTVIILGVSPLRQ